MVLMLDEPTAHLSPKFSDLIFERIVDLRDKLNLTIILVEQNVRSALEISDGVYILVSGQVAFEGRAEELLDATSVNSIATKYFLGQPDD